MMVMAGTEVVIGLETRARPWGPNRRSDDRGGDDDDRGT